MKKVEITGYLLRYKIGEIVELTEAKAESLIKAGIAKYVGKQEVKEVQEPLSKKAK